MNYFLKTLLLFCLLFSASCYGQKMVQTSADAKKLQIKNEDFKGKTLEFLLKQIKPDIKFAFGTPEGNSIAGTTIKLFFVTKEEYSTLEGKKSIGVLVRFIPETNNKREPLPKGGVNTSTKDILRKYGDMIVQGVYVTGKK